MCRIQRGVELGAAARLGAAAMVAARVEPATTNTVASLRTCHLLVPGKLREPDPYTVDLGVNHGEAMRILAEPLHKSPPTCRWFTRTSDSRRAWCAAAKDDAGNYRQSCAYRAAHSHPPRPRVPGAGWPAAYYGSWIPISR